MESTMTKLAVLSFGNQEIRTATDEHGEIWFVAADVCSALEHMNPTKAVADHVDPDDITQSEVIDSLGRKQLANHVNESGLYALIFGSRKEAAKRFKRWVTSEVLPAIRKNGQYVANAPTLPRNSECLQPSRSKHSGTTAHHAHSNKTSAMSRCLLSSQT